MFYMHREKYFKAIKGIQWKQPPTLSLMPHVPLPLGHLLRSIPVSSSRVSSPEAFWVQRAGACRGDQGWEECASVFSSITSVFSAEVIRVTGMQSPRQYSKRNRLSLFQSPLWLYLEAGSKLPPSVPLEALLTPDQSQRQKTESLVWALPWTGSRQVTSSFWDARFN